MTLEEMGRLFEKHHVESLEWDKVDPKMSDCRDLHGMLMLHALCPTTNDIVSAADHDQIWFSADPEIVAGNITEDQIKDILRCGLSYSDHEGFYSFV